MLAADAVDVFGVGLKPRGQVGRLRPRHLRTPARNNKLTIFFVTKLTFSNHPINALSQMSADSGGEGRAHRARHLRTPAHCRRRSSNPPGKFSYERPTRGIVCVTMCSMCGADAGCSAINHQSLFPCSRNRSLPDRRLESLVPHDGLRHFHRKSTYITHLNFGAYVVQIWSRGGHIPLIIDGNKNRVLLGKKELTQKETLSPTTARYAYLWPCSDPGAGATPVERGSSGAPPPPEVPFGKRTLGFGFRVQGVGFKVYSSGIIC